MRKNLSLFILLTLLLSCGSGNKNEITIYNLEKDFPTVDTLTSTIVQNFNILGGISYFFVRDSVIYIMERNPDDLGHCYNLETGEKLSTIITRGKATNELQGVPPFTKFLGKDSIQFIDERSQLVKVVSINDILTKQAGDRILTTSKLPQSINSSSYLKINGDSIVGSIDPFQNDSKELLFIYDGKDLTQFGEANRGIFKTEFNLFNIFNPQKLSDKNIKNILRTQIECHNNKLVTINKKGVLLEIYDLKTKTSIERYYNHIKVKQTEENAINSKCTKYEDYFICNAFCNDDNIYYVISQSDRLKAKKDEPANIIILKYDWQLNPVKKYHVTSVNINDIRFNMSEDCKSFYILDVAGENHDLSVYKLD